MAVTQAQVAQLYVALFNRAPEGDGFRAWVNLGANKTQSEIAQLMLESQAARDYYSGSIDSDRDYIELIYKNILGKDYTKDPDGINAWVMHLQAGNTRGETLIKLFEVAQSAEARAADPVAAAVFDNKTAISAYMAEKIAGIQQDLSGNYDYRPFQEIIKTTTATNLEEQRAKVDALASSTIHNLSTDTNDITGTVGQDIFNAVADSLVSNATLKPTDKIDGGSGENTLNVRVNDNFNGMTTGYIKNIDNLNLTSNASTAKTFNARGIEGLKRVTLDSQNGLNLLNPKNIVDVSLENLKSNVDKFNLHYNTDTIAGVNDSQNLTLDNVNLHKHAITGVVGSDDAGINIPNIETLNISTKGAKSTVAIKSGNAGTSNQNHYKTINVKGNTDLTVKAESDRIEKFDASAFTATLDYTYKPLASTPVGATNVVKGGSSKDIINLDFEKLDAGNKTNFEIDGGAGRDELNVKHLKATENKFTVNNVEKVKIEKVDTGTPSKTATMDFGGSDVTHIHTSIFKDNLKVTNSTIKGITVDKPALDANGVAVIGTPSAANPVGTTQFTNGYLEEINITNTVDPQDALGRAIIDPTKPGLRSKVDAYVQADQSEKVTVNVGENVYAQKINNNTGVWVDSNKMHADAGIGIIAPRAKDLTVNFNSPGTNGNIVANTTGISLTNVSLADLTNANAPAARSFEKLTINSKSNILSNVNASFLEKLKAFNINTDTNFDAFGNRQFNDIEQINASGLATNHIKTGNVYFVDNMLGKLNGAGNAADTAQSIGIKAEHLNSFKANAGIFTKGNINVELSDIAGNVELARGIDFKTAPANAHTASTGSDMNSFFGYNNTNNHFYNAHFGDSTAANDVGKASIMADTFTLRGYKLTNLLIGNIEARDISINPGNIIGKVNLASAGGWNDSAVDAKAVGKIGNSKTINNTIDLSSVSNESGSNASNSINRTYIGEMYGQNIKFKSSVFASPVYYGDYIDEFDVSGTPRKLFTDMSYTHATTTKNTIKVNFGGDRGQVPPPNTPANPDNQTVATLDVTGTQAGAYGLTNVYAKFDDGTTSPQTLETFKAKGEKVNLVLNTDYKTGTQSNLKTIDLSEVKAGSTSWVNLSGVKYNTDTSSTHTPFETYHNNTTTNLGFGNLGHANLKNPLYLNGNTAATTGGFKTHTTLPEWGGSWLASTTDNPNIANTATAANQALAMKKDDMGTNTVHHDKLELIKGTQGDDVMLLGDGMKAGLTVETGNGKDKVYTGTLNGELTIDGKGSGEKFYDVSRSKTNGDASHIVTIKNVKAGDKIKLADWFAHGYDADKPAGTTYGTDYGTARTMKSNQGQDTDILKNDGTNFTSDGATSNFNYTEAPTHGSNKISGDKYEYEAKYGDAFKTADSSANDQVNSNGENTGLGNTNWAGGYERGYKGKYDSTDAPKFYEGTKAESAQQQTAGLTHAAFQGPVWNNVTSTWDAPAGTVLADGVAGSANAKYMPTGSVNGIPHGHQGYFPAGTVFDSANRAFDGTTHTIVDGGAYLTADSPVRATDGGYGDVVKANTGKGATYRDAQKPGVTNLKKAVLITTAEDSNDGTTGLYGSHDAGMYDKHGIHNITVKTKYIDQGHFAQYDTLQQVINNLVSSNTTWKDAGTDLIAHPTTKFGYNNPIAPTGNAIAGTAHSEIQKNNSQTMTDYYEKQIHAVGSYDAHNHRLYAFSWKGDTYLLYNKKAGIGGTNDGLEGGADTIVKLAGVNLENLHYKVDAETGTVKILSTDSANG